MSTAKHIRGALAALLVGFTLALAPLTARAEPLTILLDWFINPDHGPLVVALEKGYFAEAGLEVTLVEPSNPNDPPKPARPRSPSPTSRSCTCRPPPACR